MTGVVVVLGAEGLVGRAIRRRLEGRFELVLVDRVPATGPAARCLELDMSAPSDIDALFRELEPDAGRVAGLIDLVAHYDFANAPDPRYTAVERGLEHLLERMGEALPEDAPFLFSSSMASLVPTEPGTRLTPESPRAGGWAYPAHKIRCEEIIEATAIPQPRVELVLAGVYTEWAELVPLHQQIERVRTSPLERHFYPGPTERGLTYVYEDDAAAAFEGALDACRGRGGVHRFLVGEEEPVTYAEIQRAASEALLGRPIRTFRVPKLLAKLGALVLRGLAKLRGKRSFIKPWMVDFAGEHFEFDISKSRSELGWRPQRRLHEELSSICARARDFTPEWQRRNGARPY